MFDRSDVLVDVWSLDRVSISGRLVVHQFEGNYLQIVADATKCERLVWSELSSNCERPVVADCASSDNQ
jgi:hypothetical protein